MHREAPKEWLIRKINCRHFMKSEKGANRVSKYRASHAIVFILGMLAFAFGYFILSTFILVGRPTPEGIVEEWGEICFWPAEDGIYAAVSPKGCYSTSCTAPRLQAGTAVVDLQNARIRLQTRFLLAKVSSFPLPCKDNCEGGGTVQFKIGQLNPNEYAVWFGDEQVGDLQVFSGRPTPRQCFTNEME